MMADRALLAATSAAFTAFALAAIAAPLASYTLALALLGLPHVLSELRYVDRRFGRRIGRTQVALILAILTAVVAIRCLTVFGLLPASIGVPAELAGVAVLALAAAAGASFAGKALALVVAAVIGLAALANPFASATFLSVLHNLTPLGFLWQLLPPGQRVRATALAAIPLLALPLLVATGAPRIMLGIAHAQFDPLNAGALAQHLFVYVPPAWLDTHRAIDLFSASVVAQGAHYLAVIVVLPVLLARIDPAGEGLVAWPRGPRFAMLCALAGTVSLAVFASGFGEARALYGIAASLHAWLEVPVLILALTGAGQRSSIPASSDAALANNATSSA